MMQTKAEIRKQDFYGPYYALENSAHLPIIYAGKGSFLCIYDIHGQLLHMSQPFDEQNLHGIREFQVAASHIELLVFSDKLIQIVRVLYEDTRIDVTLLHSFGPFDDFIWDCKVVHSHLVVGFAHNYIELYNIQGHNVSSLVAKVSCPVPCVLFSMSIVGSDTQTLRIASGTSFHEVILWSVTEDMQPVVAHTLRGHKGVIFRMRWSENNHQLLTVSDDRTARLWDVETGEEHRAFWGHTDRVWDAIFCQEYVVTSSEDSTIRVWAQDGTCLASLCGHNDDVWRLCARVDSTNHGVVYSAGTDGSVKAWPLDYHLQNSAMATDMVVVPLPTSTGQAHYELKPFKAKPADENDDAEVVEETDVQQPKKKAKCGRVSTICAVRVSSDAKEMVVCLNQGAVWRCTGRDSLHDMQLAWHDISPRPEDRADAELEQIGAFNVNWDHKLAMCAHPSGVVSVSSLHDGHLVHQWQPHPRRTLNMWLFDHPSPDPNELTCLLVTSSSDNTCGVWELGQALRLVGMVQLQKGEDVTAGCIANGLLIIGDKSGNIHVVNLTDLNGEVNAPNQTLAHVHGHGIISLITAFNTTIVSLGHDGHLVYYSQQNDLLLQVQDKLTTHPISIPEFVWLKSGTHHDVSSFIVGGWHGSNFMIWDLFNRYQLLKLEAGAWRRPHIASLDLTTCVPIPFFVCSMPRQGETWLALHRHPEAAVLPVTRYCFHASSHGKPVLCSAWVPVHGKLATNHEARYIVTAGQDGRVLLWQSQTSSDNHQLCLVCPLASHITIVRAVAISRQMGSHGIIATGGGRLALNIWTYHLTNQLQSFLLKSCSLWQRATQDHRIFCLQALSDPIQNNDHRFLLIAGDSRSILTICAVDTSASTCVTVGELSLDGYPLLSCSSAVLQRHEHGVALVMTVVGSTNGDLHATLNGVRIGDHSTMTCTLLATFKAHQMGANSVALREIAGHELEEGGFEWLLCAVSGGDDQALACTYFKVSLHIETQTVVVQHLYTEIITDASGSAIKSVEFTSNGCRCVSVGYDQRITVWTVNQSLPESLQGFDQRLRANSERLKFETAAVANVGDVSGLSVELAAAGQSSVGILVTGQGMQLASLDIVTVGEG